jgi:DNA-binding GntR family transcriptional regulator
MMTPSLPLVGLSPHLPRKSPPQPNERGIGTSISVRKAQQKVEESGRFPEPGLRQRLRPHPVTLDRRRQHPETQQTKDLSLSSS